MHEPPPPHGRHVARLSAPVPGAPGAALASLAPADGDGDGDAQPGGHPRSRVRIGFGAALVVVVVALVVAVLASILAPLGRTEVVARTGGAAAASTAAGFPAPGGVPAAAGRTSSPAGTSGAGTTGAGTTGAGTATGPPSILVHVLGAVARPGLYELHRGDRVVDAVTAAGGFTEAADQTRQNLARVVADGEQIVVPAVGEATQGGTGTGGSAGGSGAGGGSDGSAGSGAGSGAGGSGAAPAGPINLNTADGPTLETLPHVGPALAQRILDWRAANGAFTSVDDLKNVAGIGDKTFADLKDLVTV